MWGIPYDDLAGWRGPYPPEVFTSQFEKMVQGWEAGLAELSQAVEKAPSDRRADAEADLRFAQAASLHFAGVANQSAFVHARDTLASGNDKLTSEEMTKLRQEMEHRVKAELALAKQLYALAQEDSHLGFEPSCQYFYLPLDLMEKVVNCRWLLDHAPINNARDAH
jgi:hypothetical protein